MKSDLVLYFFEVHFYFQLKGMVNDSSDSSAFTQNALLDTVTTVICFDIPSVKKKVIRMHRGQKIKKTQTMERKKK